MLGKEITKENVEAATLKTFTGKWAKSKGYEKAQLYDAEEQMKLIEKLDNIEELKDIVFVFKK